MKNILFLLCFLSVNSLIWAQVEGNFKAKRAVEQEEESMNRDQIMQRERYQTNASVSGSYSNTQLNQSISDKFQSGGLTFVGENIAIFTINALSNQKAKDYVAIFNVTQLGATAEEADKLINERISKFISGMANIGVTKENVYTDMVSFVPRYEVISSKKVFSKKTFTEIPKGFILQKNIHIRYTQPEVLDKMISEAAKSEIYEIVKVDYSVESPDKTYAELRSRTFDYLNQQIEQYRKIGLRLDTAYRITTENTWAAYPANRYASYQAYSTFSVDALKNAPVAEAEKTTTSFYNAVPADAYDIVINPTILEPVVQYSYSLKVKFTLKERITPVKIEYKTDKELIIVTPNGDIKPIKLEK